MTRCFNTLSTSTDRISRVLKTELKFVFTKVGDLKEYLIVLGLWQLKIPFGFGRINFKILDLNKLRLFRFRMSESSLFHSAITDGKKEFLKKLCFILNCGML